MKTIFDRDAEGSIQNTLDLVKWDFAERKFSLALPGNFAEMSGEKQEGSYPLANRPQIILEEKQGKEQITIQFFRKVLKKEDVRNAIEQVLELTQEAFVQYTYSPVYLYRDGAVPVGWFLMHMKDMEKEHIKALFPIKEYMVLLTFTYPEEESIKWCSLKEEIFASIKEDSSGTGTIWRP